ncbi:MAG: two-component sensor histidine kinase [Prevotellaceae bacterium]|jgi:two-component system OmpR family sensor kinase/two-component system phosphate regulon sensor histidine kinase PhoR|nr:two-component sensor histidine kinase [Prevotellaceae bacterium]
MNYKQHLFLIILAIFVVFSACLVLFEQSNERKQKTEALEQQLADYIDIIQLKIKNDKLKDANISEIKLLEQLLPENLRITIIKDNGEVIYDRDFTDVSHLENHLKRPELMQAKYGGFGTNIRHSASTNQDYLYYAKFFQEYFVRVALPYNVQAKSLLKADNLFIYIVLGLFFVVLLLVNYISGRFGKSISQLKNFASDLKNNKEVEKIAFPNDELGAIGKDLVEIFRQKETAQHSTETEKEKLLQHFQRSEMGIAMFDENFKEIFHNTHFIQNQNLILNKTSFSAAAVFEDENFVEIKNFLVEREKNYRSFQIEKNGKIFEIQAVIFEDNSFEINIKNITEREKNRLVKQEMTSNIAHELRTPITSLRAYLETLSEKELDDEKRKIFIERAYIQAVRLSALIDDVSLLSKIEDNPSRFSMEKINVFELINDVRIDLSDKLKTKNISMQLDVNQQITINGNYTLLYSVFRNLLDNSIAYAGENIEIQINNYLQDENFLYFSYSDNGVGVSDEHLNRLFERFYRVQEGRTRDNGGSGLGLSIVKNAILMHGGEIQARNSKGLEFLFFIKK